jgi:hypothetical protein
VYPLSPPLITLSGDAAPPLLRIPGKSPCNREPGGRTPTTRRQRHEKSRA